mmetsp:Transcript_6844/g.15570  ORF Transcript_6844/g.15570 Transcript_6844/m.15570 type:complete len:227 (+) Transcript_6844:1085-1765(+)
MTNRGQDFIHLATTCVHIQTKGGDHVTHRFDASIQVVVGFFPGHIVHLRVQLGVHLVLEVDDILGQVLLLLLHLLQGVGHILHPTVVVLQGFLDVPDVQTHGGDFRRHCRLHTLTAGDDRMGGINTGSHLIQVHIHGIHGSSEVLHVTLAGQDDAADMVHFALIVAKEVFQFAHVVLQLVQILGHGIQASRTARTVHGLRGAGSAVHVAQLFVEIRLQIGELRRDL